MYGTKSIGAGAGGEGGWGGAGEGGGGGGGQTKFCPNGEYNVFAALPSV